MDDFMNVNAPDEDPVSFDYLHNIGYNVSQYNTLYWMEK